MHFNVSVTSRGLQTFNVSTRPRLYENFQRLSLASVSAIYISCPSLVSVL